jgi:hypothetical protein
MLENPTGVMKGVTEIMLDGQRQPDGQGIPLLDDGKVHRVEVKLGK